MRTLVLATLLALILSACSSRTDRNAGGAPEVSTRLVTKPHPVFSDTDAHDWDGRMPTHYPVHGIDVSRWQGPVDWRRARDAGVAFAFIKATEGGDYLDPMFESHWASAKQAGVRHGAYHYFYFCRPAAEQARWFIAHVPRDPKALPPVLDMEWNHQSRTCRLRPDPKKIRAEAKIFLDILERHYGRRPIVYTTVDFFHETGIGQLANTRFWLRSVAGHPSDVYPGKPWLFWQYTGTGVVPGINGPADINVFAGSVAQWHAWVN